MSSQKNTSEVNISLALCTLGYIEKQCLDSIMRSQVAGCFSSYVTIEGSLMPYARNLAVQKVYESGDTFSHILFVDDDMCNFDYRHISELVKASKDIVSGVTVSRRPPYKIVNSFQYPDRLPEYIKKNQVVQCKAVGMAFTLIKKEVFDKCGEDIVDGRIWFTSDRSERLTFEAEVADFINKNKDSMGKDTILEAIAMGQNAHLGTPIIGEDIGFCERASKFGFKCWTHCGVPVAHIGSNPHEIKDALGNNDSSDLCLQRS